MQYFLSHHFQTEGSVSLTTTLVPFAADCVWVVFSPWIQACNRNSNDTGAGVPLPTFFIGGDPWLHEDYLMIVFALGFVDLLGGKGGQT